MRVQIRLPSDFLHPAASLRAAASSDLLIDSRLNPAVYPAKANCRVWLTTDVFFGF